MHAIACVMKKAHLMRMNETLDHATILLVVVIVMYTSITGSTWVIQVVVV